MKISEIKHILQSSQSETLSFELENGTKVPAHFHITEVGVISKHFIDCGGTERKEKVANFQLWSSTDYDHRLSPNKLLKIIKLSEKILGEEDLEIEVEYQSETIGKYNLNYQEGQFILASTKTACLAQDQCGIPVTKPKIRLSSLQQNQGQSCCSPEQGCC